MAKWDLSKLEKPQFGAAQARRFYMHVQEGGTLTARDVARMVEALEEVFQMYVDANEARIDAEAKLTEQDALWEGMERSLEESDAREARLEAKLAKAVELLGYWRLASVGHVSLRSVIDKHDATLAELKGQDQ